MCSLLFRKRGVRPLLAAGVLLFLTALPAGARVRGEWVTMSPRDLLLNEALEVRVSVEYEVPTDLRDIIAFLNEAIENKLKLRAALHVDPRIVELNPRPVQITLANTRVRKILTLLLTDATTEEEEQGRNELGFIPYYQAGVIYVSNRQRLLRLNMKRKVYRFYDVRDLLAKFPVGGRDNDDDDDDDDDWY